MAMITRHTHVASAGVLAAELLVKACEAGDGLHLETVRDLAEDLRRRLRQPPGGRETDSLVEAALACADLATLAVCNIAALPGPRGRPPAVAATHLAAGAARALAALGEAEIGDREDAYAGNASRDLRSAGWKADLALRQLGETA